MRDRMMLRICIWFVASIFLLPRRQKSVEQWCLNMILWSMPNCMICLWMKSTTATLIARCEESWATSASLWVVSLWIHNPSVWDFKNIFMDRWSARDGVEKTNTSYALISIWAMWLSWRKSVEKILMLCLQYVVSSTDSFICSMISGRHVLWWISKW